LTSGYFSNTSATDIKNYMAYLSNKAGSAVSANSTKGMIFREIEIEGMRFSGSVGRSGPAINNVVPDHHFWDGGSVPLGRVTEIHYCPAFRRNSVFAIEYEAGWWICKYGPDEPRINITSLSEEGRNTLAYQFGIPIYPHSETQTNCGFPAEWKLPKHLLLPDGDILFFMSPAFKDLCTWVQAHPRHARSSKFKELYLRGWKKAAIKSEFVPAWQGWRGDSIRA
jgi:hypothetical protein